MRTPHHPADLLLDDRLCLALHMASRAMTSRYRPHLDELGLTYPQYLVMVLLWEEGGATVSEIGERLRLTSSTLSPLLQRLGRSGLVTKQRSTEDERVVVVTPTDAGLAMRDQASGIVEDICEATGMSVADQVELVATLRELVDHLDDRA